MEADSTAGGLTLADFKTLVAPGFRSHQPEDPETWLPRHIRFPSGSEETNFDFDQAPYVRGVIQLFWNDHRRRKCNLPWGVRLGKTMTVLSLLLWQACNAPCPMGLLFPNNDTLAADLDDVVNPLMDAIPIVRSQLQPIQQRNRSVIRLRDCRVRIASAGKKASVSGYPAKRIGKLEHEKIDRRSSSEANASGRMDSRADGYPRDVKILEEGSPSDVTTSHYHELEQDPDVLKFRFVCPCPHCGHHQTLEHEQVRWERDADGRESATTARKTAWFECAGCEGRVEDHHRIDMICAGKWIADGQSIDSKGRITGTPLNDDADTMILGPLSTYYSLRIAGWGTLAGEYVTAKNLAAQGKVDKLRKFWNEKLARVWNPLQRRTKTPAVAKRLTCEGHDVPGVLPPWTSFLTFTVDVGNLYEELIFYWMTVAWGSPHGVARGAVIDWGFTEGKAAFLAEWKELKYPLDGSAGDVLVPLWGQPAAIDSGDGEFTREICELCKTIKLCWPLKGDSNPKATEFYDLGFQRLGLTSRQLAMKKKAGKVDLLLICSWPTQSWRQALVEGRTLRTTAGYVSLPAETCERWKEQTGFLDSLTADMLIDGSWQGDANEYGDTLRYARAVAAWHTNNDKKWHSLPLIQARLAGAARMFTRTRSPSSERFVNGWE